MLKWYVEDKSNIKAADGWLCCALSLLPIRAQASHRSEQVTQLLYGESFKVLERRDDWLLIRSEPDGYEGWVPAGAEENAFSEWEPTGLHCASLSGKRYWRGEYAGLLYPGCPLPRIEGMDYECRQTEPRLSVETVAPLFLHTPYLWGGRSPGGIDCSGLVQVVYRLCGIALPRDAYQQAECGTAVDFEECALGDLAFFANAQGRIVHVGIVWKGGRILHAATQVRLDQLHPEGILHGGRLSHSLTALKRL